ncbi:molybdenum cofactor guanylyltransferase [Alkalicoccus halolimnae]|uniref:Probable molybdenum cofactor guanylyltransferase n=1 Tax=Alkalicoccus halolimnae TaxID=1667239 RepID=A0A5C7FBY2_9BACI|nr:molybdenum cofactor guanylyltransferase [Alkalicoccus halolimnae]TXF81962.1 molybdenum cofactor guanylyltransferase [Alkalicoccus halolimnae]
MISQHSVTAGIVLAGGKSSRMGENKALLPISGKTALEHALAAVETVSDKSAVITNEPESLSFLKIPVIEDLHPYEGPMAGMEAAMTSVSAEWYIFTACDMPLIHPDVIRLIKRKTGTENVQAVIPMVDGRLQPLLAGYHQSCLPLIKECLQLEKRSINSLIEKINFDIITYHDMIEAGISQDNIQLSFYNMNNRQEYEWIINRYS